MKKLVLLRHAAAEPMGKQSRDIERRLSSIGELEAQDVALQLQQLPLMFDAIICSPAQRTRQTVDVLLHTMGLPNSLVSVDERIFENIESGLLELISEVKSSIQTLLLVGHNPCMSLLARYFCPDVVESLPTAGVCILEFPDQDWSLMQVAEARSKLLLTPRHDSF